MYILQSGGGEGLHFGDEGKEKVGKDGSTRNIRLHVQGFWGKGSDEFVQQM